MKAVKLRINQINVLRSCTVSILTSFVLFNSEALANWSANIGYNNPPGAVGVNFLHWKSNIGLEIGIGSVAASSENEDTDKTPGGKDTDGENNLRVGGAVNAKYFLTKGGIAPYVQIGFGAGFGISSDEDGSKSGVALGGLYGGLGIMFGNPKLYFYGGGISDGGPGSVQAGIGFDI